MNDKKTTLQELKDLLQKFSDERAWEKYETPRNLATSISIEAAELLEHYQWNEDGQDKEEIENELADIVKYCIHFAITSDIDLAAAVERKNKKDAAKFPPEIVSNNRGNLDEYWKIKKSQRNKEE